MQEALDRLAEDIKVTVAEACAKAAEIHRIRSPENDFQRGYNQAIIEIAEQIRRLK